MYTTSLLKYVMHWDGTLYKQKRKGKNITKYVFIKLQKTAIICSSPTDFTQYKTYSQLYDRKLKLVSSNFSLSWLSMTYFLETVHSLALTRRLHFHLHISYVSRYTNCNSNPYENLYLLTHRSIYHSSIPYSRN